MSAISIGQTRLLRSRPDRSSRCRSASTWRASTRPKAASSRAASGSAPSSAASTASSAPTRSQEQDWKSYAKSVVIFSVIFSLVLYGLLRLQGVPLPQPRRPARRPLAHLAEHHRELRHEHELAVLRRRVHDVVPEPDGRARRAELRLGRGRHGRPRRGHPRLHAPLGEDAGELLAGPLPLAAPTSSCPLSIVLSASAHLAGRAADLRRRRDRDDGRGRRAVDRPRTGRLADRDQAARDERRRLLQLELGRPLREPERAHELPRDALDPAHPGGPRLHVREDGRRAEAGLRGLRGHVRDVRDRRGA